MSEKLLSLCMIVRDEADTLARCLASVKGIVDETIVVDTGSRDDTAAVARAHGAEIYDFKWTGSFAEARNYSLSKATGAWSLWMDADEALESRDAEALREFVRASSRHQLLYAETLHYIGSGRPDPRRAYRMAQHRLFPGGGGYAFEGAIHERLRRDGAPVADDAISLIPARIHHFGYMDDIRHLKKKRERNLLMLQKEKQSGCSDPWTDYHIAGELAGAGSYKDAFAAVNAAIAGALQNGQLPPIAFYRLKYAILLASGSEKGAWPGIDRAVALYPDDAGLRFYKGVILYRNGQYGEAVEAFRNCLALGERCGPELTEAGIGSFRAYELTGRCFELLGDSVEAAAAYGRAAAIHADHEKATNRLTRIEAGRNET
ncbi:glycosyltransferase [Cohnella sp. GCM10012308]|uniref:glycosyltransferase family 2 protein n=1 Tax=Cohnella sp. GCM10012308 TaxID=3317329 RepID=UPI00360B3A40